MHFAAAIYRLTENARPMIELFFHVYFISINLIVFGHTANIFFVEERKRVKSDCRLVGSFRHCALMWAYIFHLDKSIDAIFIHYFHCIVFCKQSEAIKLIKFLFFRCELRVSTETRTKACKRCWLLHSQFSIYNIVQFHFATLYLLFAHRKLNSRRWDACKKMYRQEVVSIHLSVGQLAISHRTI